MVEAQQGGTVWRIGYLEGRGVIVDRRCFPTSNTAAKLVDEVLADNKERAVSQQRI